MVINHSATGGNAGSLVFRCPGLMGRSWLNVSRAHLVNLEDLCLCFLLVSELSSSIAGGCAARRIVYPYLVR